MAQIPPLFKCSSSSCDTITERLRLEGAHAAHLVQLPARAGSPRAVGAQDGGCRLSLPSCTVPALLTPPLTPLEIVSHRTRLTASLCQPPRTPSTTASPTSTTPGNTRSLGTGVWAHPAWLQRPPTHTEPHLRRVLLQLGGVQPDITRFGLLGCVAFPPALHPRHRAVSRSAELSRVPRKGRGRGRGATSDAGSGPAPFFPPSPRAPPPPNGRQRLPRALVGERDQSERLGRMSGRSSPAHPGPCPI